MQSPPQKILWYFNKNKSKKNCLKKKFIMIIFVIIYNYKQRQDIWILRAYSCCRTSKFSRSFRPAQVLLWNDLPYTVFDTGTLDGFKGAVNRWLLPWVVFSSVFRGRGACGVAKAIYKQLCFPLCCWFWK